MQLRSCWGLSFARHTIALKKNKRRGSTEPRRYRLLRIHRSRSKKSYFFFAAFFLAAGFFAAFFLAAMLLHLLLSDKDPRFHGLVISFSW